MARLFAVLVTLFLGGSLVAALVAGTLWPVICAALALVVLVKVFAAADRAAPPPHQPAAYRGKPDRRMPT